MTEHQKGSWSNELDFIHAFDETIIPISVVARIYAKNPMNNRIDPRKIIKTEIKEKSEALKFYNKAAKEGLAAAKMQKMAEGLGRDFIKFSVSNN